MAIKSKIIPDKDHVARYVPFSRQVIGPDGNVGGVTWSALQQRKTEDAVSVNWLEYHDGSKPDQLKLIKDELTSSITIKAKALLAIGNVGDIKRVCNEAGTNVRVVHQPSTNSLSHAGIRRLPTDPDGLLDILVAEVFIDTIQLAQI